MRLEGPADRVREFHREVVGNLDRKRTVKNHKYGLLRVRLIQEELTELTKALSERDRVDVADALADLLYVTYGAAVMFDIPIEQVFDEVHRANMQKGGDRDEGGKVQKQDGFAEPDIEGVLEAYDSNYPQTP